MGNNRKTSHFATKVVIVILLVSLIPNVLNSIFYYVSSSSIVKENVRESTLQIARQAADSLSHIFLTGSDMSDLIYSNRMLQDIVKQDLQGNLSYIKYEENNEYMSSYLNSNIYSSSFIRMIYVIRDQGKSWGSGTFSEYKLSQYNLQELDWVEESIKADGEVTWQGLQYDKFSGAGNVNTEFILPISRTMKDFDTLTNIAYIQVYLDGQKILERISQIKLGETGRFFVVDQTGIIMIDGEMDNLHQLVPNEELKDYILTGEEIEFEFISEGKPHYGVKQPLSNGWTLVGVVPIHEITGELNKIQSITIAMSLLFMLLAIIVGYLSANRVTEPIKVLTTQMKQVEKGDFNVKTKVQTTDEIGVMSKQFNTMIERLKDLIQQVKIEQTNKKEAELRAVRHRINPHFLFNTLSTIKWLMNLEQFQRANLALSALTRLLEANMGKKGTFITVNEELDIIEKFIEILQIRYEQTFHLHLDIEPGVNEVKIPQMLLQPIVENAIFHGIVPTGKEGSIYIDGRKIADGIELEVRNDGKVMDQEILAEIEHAKDTHKGFVGIGLLHVFDSVNLYYSADSKVDITSTANGTKVRLTLKSEDRGGEDV
ncbi:hypothetical protein BKP35_05560 [Anaerobacillus arseniciselenatis]|uniref:HAMP domain-containing protein n=1 Tax=Anaerobacillus arseniciselenatis TaxID=85682 RepID=A0A1S2LQV3_9BACI|nr:sensor histidine kinase [Anaerobacillus arseniciselenatis]OIJ14899.1 hypothetical protein BKP35_05560 [Anaerobacillus arseniciselenatis]